MDLLNRAFAQANALIRRMSPRARVTSCLVLGALAVAIALLVQVQSRGSQVLLLEEHVFTSRELTAIQAAFGKAGLSEFEVVRGQINVPRKELGAYLNAMAEADVLPADFSDYWMKTLQAQSPWTSSRVHDQAMLAAQQRALSNSIGHIPGIDSAQVFISVLDKSDFRGHRLITASVDVKMEKNRSLDSQQVRAIRGLVSGGMAGLKPQQITVVDSTGRVFAGYSGASTDDLDEAYFLRQESFAQRYEEAILKILSHIPGVTASVQVELGPRGETLPVASTEPTGPQEQQSSPQAANTQASLESKPSSAPTPSSEPKRLAADVKIQELFPRRVTASISIPSSYFDGLWRQQTRQSTDRKGTEGTSKAGLRAEVSDKIQRHVLTVIPHDPSEPAARLVSVTSFDALALDASADVATKVAPALVPKRKNWRIGILCAAAVAGLVLLWTVIPAPGAQAGTPRQTAATTSLRTDGPHEPSPLRTLARRPAGSGEPLREDLADVVRENPDAAASILRTWIGNAS